MEHGFITLGKHANEWILDKKKHSSIKCDIVAIDLNTDDCIEDMDMPGVTVFNLDIVPDRIQDTMLNSFYNLVSDLNFIKYCDSKDFIYVEFDIDYDGCNIDRKEMIRLLRWSFPHLTIVSAGINFRQEARYNESWNNNIK